MLNYPSGVGKTWFLPTSDVASKEECRAHRVFKNFIPVLMERYNCEEKDVFKFESRTITKDGEVIPGHNVFSCGYCAKDDRRDPAKYDLFDGIDSTGVLRDIGICDELEPALRDLNSDERLSLSVLKVYAPCFI